jgi:hypothetical protein
MSASSIFKFLVLSLSTMLGDPVGLICSLITADPQLWSPQLFLSGLLLSIPSLFFARRFVLAHRHAHPALPEEMIENTGLRASHRPNAVRASLAAAP